MSLSPFSFIGKRIWVTGHTGMVGSALVRRLANEEVKIITSTRREVDLRRQADTEAWMDKNRPQIIVIAAATVGGIMANSTRPAEFLYDNLLIASNIIATAHQLAVEKVLFLGSSCIYPRQSPQPIPEEALLTGPLEPTNEWYAIAKIAGTKLCQAFRRQYGDMFISAHPCNLYGPHDRFDSQSGHVIAALLLKMHLAKINALPSVTIWGSGTPKREFLHVDDLANAMVFLLANYHDESPINIGSGYDVTIRQLAEQMQKVVGYSGELIFDHAKPDGMPRKLLDSTRLRNMGWQPTIAFEQGLHHTYQWFLEHAQPSTSTIRPK